jgi:large subunit ribosomal protein L9
MEVILLEKINKLGDLGDVVKVKSGYGRNYLVPHKKAVLASAEALQDIELHRADLQKAEDEKLAIAQERAIKVEELDITLTAKAGEEGKMYGSIGTRDIAEAAVAAGVPLEKSEVRLPTGVIRELGEYEITVQLHSEVNVFLKLGVVLE